MIQIKKTDLSNQLPITLTLKQREKNVEKTNTEPITKPEEIIQPKPPVQNSAEAEVLNELTILSDPSGAKVFVNGVNTGLITPTVLKRRKGVYIIQVIKDGYESASRSVEFSGEGNKQTINLIQKALLVKVSITSQPSGAKIYLDNSFTSLYTPATISLSIGSHTIMVGKAGFEEQAIDIVVKPGVPLQPIFFTLKHKPGVNRVSGNMVMPYEN